MKHTLLHQKALKYFTLKHFDRHEFDLPLLNVVGFDNAVNIELKSSDGEGHQVLASS